MPAPRIYTPALSGGGVGGTVWLSSTVDPVDSDGSIGNWWNNTTTGAVFEKTGASVWSTRGNLLGLGNANAEEVMTFPFSFNTASPAICFEIPANARVLTAQVIITIPFDDAAATLKIGDATDDDRLMTISQNSPSEAAEYESNTYHQYLAATNILLTITPYASTIGSGVVVVEYNLNT